MEFVIVKGHLMFCDFTEVNEVEHVQSTLSPKKYKKCIEKLHG